LIWAGRAAVVFLPEAIELGRETETGKELEQQAKDWTVENTGLSEEKVEQGFEAGFLLAANANLAKSGAKQVGKGAAKVGEKLTGLVKGGSKKPSAPKLTHQIFSLLKRRKKVPQMIIWRRIYVAQITLRLRKPLERGNKNTKSLQER
jgi:hypothetical protein